MKGDIPHGWSGIGLNSYTFSSFLDVNSSPPNQFNHSSMDSCLGVILWPNNMSTYCNVVQILSTSTSSGKTNGVVSHPASWQLQVPLSCAQTQAPYDIPSHECLGQCLCPFQLNLFLNHRPMTILSYWHQWYTYSWRGRHVITIAVYKITNDKWYILWSHIFKMNSMYWYRWTIQTPATIAHFNLQYIVFEGSSVMASYSQGIPCSHDQSSVLLYPQHFLGLIPMVCVSSHMAPSFYPCLYSPSSVFLLLGVRVFIS